jgi:hypothetical protein
VSKSPVATTCAPSIAAVSRWIFPDSEADVVPNFATARDTVRTLGFLNGRGVDLQIRESAQRASIRRRHVDAFAAHIEDVVSSSRAGAVAQDHRRRPLGRDATARTHPLTRSEDGRSRRQETGDVPVEHQSDSDVIVTFLLLADKIERRGHDVANLENRIERSRLPADFPPTRATKSGITISRSS